MNCDLEGCGKHILATMQIEWQGKNYHPDCVGEAVARYRAAETREDAEIKEAFQDLDDDNDGFEQQFDDEFEERFAAEFEEDFDDLEVGEELNEELGKSNAIKPEIIHQVKTNGEAVNSFQMPKGAIIATPKAFHPPPNGNGLTLHCGAQRISRNDLTTLEVPEATATFKPIPHSTLVEVVEEALAFRHIRIVDEEFAVSPDGMKLFAVLRVNADYEGVGFSIGLRNANDKSMRVGIVSGYRVFCCDNLAFSGDFNPMLQKHSKNLDLVESVSIAVDRIQRQWQPLRTAIDYKRNHFLNEDVARNMIYRLFTDYKLPISLFRTVHKEYFVNPSFQEFEEKTLWSFENAITTAFKKLNPIPRYEQTATVGKFIADYIQSSNN